MSENKKKNNKKSSLTSKNLQEISSINLNSEDNNSNSNSNGDLLEPSLDQQQQSTDNQQQLTNFDGLNQSFRKLFLSTSTTSTTTSTLTSDLSSSSAILHNNNNSHNNNIALSSTTTTTNRGLLSSPLTLITTTNNNNTSSFLTSSPPSSSSSATTTHLVNNSSLSSSAFRNFSFIPMATDEEDDDLLSSNSILNTTIKSSTSNFPKDSGQTELFNQPLKPQRSWNVKLKNTNLLTSKSSSLSLNLNGSKDESKYLHNSSTINDNNSSNNVLSSSSIKLLTTLARVNSIPISNDNNDNDDDEDDFSTNQLQLQLKTNNNSSCHNNSNNNNTISDENYNFVSVEHADTSFPVFLELWENRKICDVVIKVGEQKFYAHRVILCATIPYFYAMFTNDLAEKSKTEIVLQQITETEIDCTPSLDSDAFKSLLRYAYTGTIVINSRNVQSMLIGSSFLGLTNVQQACADYLKIRLNVTNVLNVISFAFVLGCDTLVTASKRFIYRHFETISKTDDFLNLDYDDVVDIIDKDQLNICSEEIVFQAIVDWTKRNEEDRRDKLSQLLSYVRLPLLSPEYLIDTVMTEKLIRNSLQCRDLVDEAKDFHLLPERRELIQRFRSRPRFGRHIQGLIYAVGGLTKNGDSMSTVEVYDPHTKRWRMAEAMTMLRSRVGVAVMDGKLYAIGGYNGKERLNTVEVYDARLKRWNKVTSMCYRRSAVGAAALSGHLFVCGGYDGTTSLNAVERYSAINDRWELMSSMNFHRSAAGVVAFDGYIYALGGHDGMMIFNSVERYDPRTNSWEMVEPMLTRRCRLGVASFCGKIYVCGGYDGRDFLPSAEVFDPNTGKWSLISSMRLNRSRVALVANCGRLFAIGGYDGITNLSSVEMYDIEHDYWEFTSSMVAHEGGVGVGVIPDKLP